MNVQPLWRTEEVSNFLNVKKGTIRYWVHIKAIRFHKIGNLVRYIPKEIMDDFQQGKIGVPGAYEAPIKIVGVVQAPIKIVGVVQAPNKIVGVVQPVRRRKIYRRRRDDAPLRYVKVKRFPVLPKRIQRQHSREV